MGSEAMQTLPPPPPHHDPTSTVTSAVVGLLASARGQEAVERLIKAFIGDRAPLLPSLGLAYSLAAFASDLDEGDLRAAIQREATRLVQKAAEAAASLAKAAKA